MGKGQRVGVLTKAQLLQRLDAVAPNVAPRTASLKVLLGHAMYHRCLTEREEKETTPRTESTMACYLFTHVLDPGIRAALEQYVQAASRLYRRGSVIANLMAISAFGSAFPGPTRQRFDEDTQLTAAQEGFMRALFGTADVRSCPIKQVFLPERWPSSETPRDAVVDSVLEAHGDVIPALPDWTAVMQPSGWDNAINRMATKFFGNVQVHAMVGLVSSVQAYLREAPLREGTSRDLVLQMLTGPLRPCTAVHDDDWAMLHALRSAIGLQDDDVVSYLRPAFSPALCRLHLFLVRCGTKDRSYLPVVRRGRKYCYLDAKVCKALIAEHQRQEQRRRRAAGEKAARRASAISVQGGAGGDGDEPDERSTVSVGELLGVTPRLFNQRRAALRRTIVKQHKSKGKAATDAKKRARYKRLAERWARLGGTRMHPDARIDSLETDGVGLRLCIKTPVPMQEYCVALPADRGETSASLPRPRESLLRRAPGGRTAQRPDRQAPIGAGGDDTADPVHVGVDLGRAKLYTAAISRCGRNKPTSLSFRRGRHIHERLDRIRARWERDQMAASPQVAAALVEQSESGGLRNCRLANWRAYLAVDRAHSELLDAEFLRVDRSLWAMRKFRRRKASLDRAASRLVQGACTDEPLERPLVLTIGDAKFASGGRGEVSVPTTSLGKALDRAVRRERDRGRAVVVQSVDEYLTTTCCCECGMRTTAARVTQGGKRTGEVEHRASRRLRQCTGCDPAGKLRDRDVQAARNMLWIGQALYHGWDRPSYLCRPQPLRRCAG